MATLSTLPNEIISIITSHFDRPRDLLHLALTCRRLSEFAKLDGWKALLKGRFHISGLDADAQNAVHGLTTLYRNWTRKGFIARYLEPSTETTSLNTWEPAPWRGPRGQTMGYQPSIDSYEETLGLWARRREVLAWSAGTQIVMREKEAGLRSKDAAQDSTQTVDSFGHLICGCFGRTRKSKALNQWSLAPPLASSLDSTSTHSSAKQSSKTSTLSTEPSALSPCPLPATRSWLLRWEIPRYRCTP
ncbi:hypothetical protein OPT61_g6678 [Boeremia exigua]|uniref:Uncharacterized protein n=1 Tax=Boeremia exigua TaxID=749465 RepID=A0ACC2I609_9PLEO|nr:hypothetical protein OPT61_g6678 [Boeremia exigua]